MKIPGRTKRQKEASRAEHRQEQESRREQRRKGRAERAVERAASTEDPDLVGIVPGPQRPPT